jgi:hypothetical protein
MLLLKLQLLLTLLIVVIHVAAAAVVAIMVVVVLTCRVYGIYLKLWDPSFKFIHLWSQSDLNGKPVYQRKELPTSDCSAKMRVNTWRYRKGS